MQVKLLRVPFQQREIQRVGGDATLKVDVRIVAATNRNLLDEVAAGRFREDLYYRLNVVSIRVPSLGAPETSLLAEHFTQECSASGTARTSRVHLRRYGHAGQVPVASNVHELENAVERGGAPFRELHFGTDCRSP